MTTENLDELRSRKRTLSSTSIDQCRKKLSRPLPSKNMSTRLRCRDTNSSSQTGFPLREQNSNSQRNEKTEEKNSTKKKDIKEFLETDPHRIQKRQRQLDIGKNTPGYSAYLKDVPRTKRTSKHPHTPDKFRSCSTRSWQSQIKTWRRQLHIWDPPEVNDENREDPFQ